MGRPASVRCGTRRALRWTWFRAPDEAKRTDGRRRQMSPGQKRGQARRTPPTGDGVKGGLNGNGAGGSMLTKKILHLGFIFLFLPAKFLYFPFFPLKSLGEIPGNSLK